MSLQTNIFGVILLFGAVAARGQTAALQPHITEGDVAEGMREKGIAIRVEQIGLLSTIPARMEHPVLEAVKIEPLAADTSRVLMRCTDRSSCIPFYAVVHGLTSSEKALQNSPKPQSRVSVRQEPAGGPILMKRGSTVTLEIVAPEMVITVSVVCLQSGRQGERIRVSAVDQQKTYLGEVVSPGLLRSQL